MAYALNSEKWYSTWIPDDVFLFWIQSEVKFYFGPTKWKQLVHLFQYQGF